MLGCFRCRGEGEGEAYIYFWQTSLRGMFPPFWQHAAYTSCDAYLLAILFSDQKMRKKSSRWVEAKQSQSDGFEHDSKSEAQS